MTEALHDLQIERALLGGLIRSPAQIGELGDLSGVWWAPEHRELYQLLRSTPADQIDSVSVPYLAHQRGGVLTGQVGYISGLTGHCPSTANLGHYATELRRMASVTRCRWMGDEVSQASTPTEMREIARRLLDVASGGDDDVRSVYLAEAGRHEIERMRGGVASTVDTGVSALDEALGGLPDRTLTLIAGRPAMGKSALAECIAMDMARRGLGVAYCSLELSAGQVWQRQMARMTGIPVQALRGELHQRQWSDLIRAQEETEMGLDGGPWPIRIQDSPAQRVSDVEAHALATARAVGRLDLVVVDYLQIMGVDRETQRSQAVGEAAYALRDLAKALDVPVVALTQLNRDLEKRQDKRPKQADLYESDKLNQAADLIIGCHRPVEFDESADPLLMELCVMKNRAGKGGAGAVIRAGWDGPRLSVTQYVDRREDDSY